MSLHDHTPGGDLIFPEDLSGTEFRLLDLELYSNDDDAKKNVPEGDVHGNWLHVRTPRGEFYMSAPGELIEELQRHAAEPGDHFEVTRAVKSGPKQTDPYEINVEDLDPDQSRLA